MRLLPLVTVAVLAVSGCASAGQDAATAPAGATDTREGTSAAASASAGADPSPSAEAGRSPSAPAPSVPAQSPTGDASPSHTTALLRPADHGDGDSWRDTTGREYRLGMVNAPELDECFGAEAAAERKARTADGFRAEVYTEDRYGRGVAVVRTADGSNLNVHLARQGFVDDRYLADFRHENPPLAAELDAAFAAARAEGRGLWTACRGGSGQAPPEMTDAAPVVGAPAAAVDGCHPDYTPCVPVRGDGSGTGRANDLDCGDVDGPVRVKTPGVDPYRFDGDGDGTGCDS